MISCNQQYMVHTTEMGEMHEARTHQRIATGCKMDSRLLLLAGTYSLKILFNSLLFFFNWSMFAKHVDSCVQTNIYCRFLDPKRI